MRLAEAGQHIAGQAGGLHGDHQHQQVRGGGHQAHAQRRGQEQREILRGIAFMHRVARGAAEPHQHDADDKEQEGSPSSERDMVHQQHPTEGADDLAAGENGQQRHAHRDQRDHCGLAMLVLRSISGTQQHRDDAPDQPEFGHRRARSSWKEG